MTHLGTARHTPRVQRARGVWRAAPERGGAIPEYAIVLPVLILLLMTIAQLGMWMHARNVAASAAQVGVQAATAHDATTAHGAAAANAHLDMVGSTQLQGAHVSAAGTNAEVVITVRGSAKSLIPGTPLPDIEAVSRGSKERLTR